MRLLVSSLMLSLLLATLAPAARGQGMGPSYDSPSLLPLPDAIQLRDTSASLALPAGDAAPGESITQPVSPDAYRPPADGYPYGEMSPACDQCPRHGLVAFLGYDSWRGPVDDSWANNGIHKGANFGTHLGPFSDWTGFGGQIGGSVGVYDWSGTEYRIANQDVAEVQGFLTYGLFRKANDETRWSASLVQDWMFNYNYGALSQRPTLAQWRWQLGYATDAWNEWGFWGTKDGGTVTRDVAGYGIRTYKSIDQLNVYQHHKWAAGGADTWLWVGVPERSRLSGDHTLGDYQVGALINAPLGDRIGFYSLVTYMHPSASPGPAASLDEMWNFSIGLTFYPYGSARTSTVAGQCWMPQLPVANNGTFLVDTNATY